MILPNFYHDFLAALSYLINLH